MEYDPTNRPFSRPLADAADPARYASFLYHVHRSYSGGWRDASPSLVINNMNLFNVSFSGSDPQITGLEGKNAAGGRCVISNNDCLVQNFTARTNPETPDGYISAGSLVSIGNFSASHTISEHRVMSNSSRLGTLAILNSVSQSGARYVNYMLYQYEGRGFGDPINNYVVDRVRSSSGLAASDRNQVEYRFDYWKQPLWTLEFNSQSQSPQFETAEAVQVNGAGGSLGGSHSVFHLDKKSSPLNGSSAPLVGMEYYQRVFSAAGDTSLAVDTHLRPHRNGQWPSAMNIARPYKVFRRERSRNKAYRDRAVTFHAYNENSGAPQFTVEAQGPGPHRVHQVNFDEANLPFQSFSYMAAVYPDTAGLKNASPLQPLHTQANYTALTPVSSSKTFRVFKYRFSRQEIWRDEDQNLSEFGMKTGATPVFNIAEGWIPTGEVKTWNDYNQVRESKVVRSAVLGDESYQSNFFEGLASLPVGVIQNSKLVNCGMLLAENGNAGLSGLDYHNKWEKPAAVTFHSGLSHSGQYSLKIQDTYGPTANFVLTDVDRDRLGFIVSVWIYAKPGSTPLLAVERRGATGGGAPAVLGQPVEGYVNFNRWQRWEAKLSYATLKEGGMFANGVADYLRIWAGTGAPTSNPNNVVYVDDFICMPTNATYSLSTFDEKERRSSSTGSNHVTTFYEYGARGDLMSVRDENFRIFSQTGHHRVGEN